MSWYIHKILPTHKLDNIEQNCVCDFDKTFSFPIMNIFVEVLNKKLWVKSYFLINHNRSFFGESRTLFFRYYIKLSKIKFSAKVIWVRASSVEGIIKLDTPWEQFGWQHSKVFYEKCSVTRSIKFEEKINFLELWTMSYLKWNNLKTQAIGK